MIYINRNFACHLPSIPSLPTSSLPCVAFNLFPSTLISSSLSCLSQYFPPLPFSLLLFFYHFLSPFLHPLSYLPFNHCFSLFFISPSLPLPFSYFLSLLLLFPHLLFPTTSVSLICLKQVMIKERQCLSPVLMELERNLKSLRLSARYMLSYICIFYLASIYHTVPFYH